MDIALEASGPCRQGELGQALKHDLAEAKRLDSRNEGLREALKTLKA